MAGAVNHVNGVWKKRRNRVERLDRATGTSWKIGNDSFCPNAYNPAREQRTLREFSTVRAHVFSKPWY